MGKFIGTTGLLYLWNKIKSIIPTKVSDLTNDSGFTSNVGTITGVTMNGASKGTSGVVDLGTVITAHQDISGKQDTISNVTVAVDANTGTPSGTVTFSNNTLAFSFQNLKGAKGDTGAQGKQGVQGEKGPQGDTGVQVDSVASIIHSIDPTATYAAADVAGADAVQEVQSEITGLYERKTVISGWTSYRVIYCNQGEGEAYNTTPQYLSQARYVIIPVAEGEKYIVNGKGGNSPRLWCFADANNKIISAAAANAQSTNDTLVLTPPANATQLIINNTVINGDCYILTDGDVKKLNENVYDVILPLLSEDVSAEVETTFTSGYITSSGGVSTSNYAVCSDFVKIETGNRYVLYTKLSSGWYIGYYTAADASTFVSSEVLGNNTDTQVLKSLTVPATAQYMRVTKDNSANSKFYEISSVLLQEKIGNTLEYIKKEALVKKYTIKLDGTGDFTDFVTALSALANDETNKEIYLEGGVHDILSQMGGQNYINSIPSDVQSSSWPLYSNFVPNNTKIIGIGNATLDFQVPDGTSANKMGVLCPLAFKKNVTIENITITAKNCRYCIHDETSSDFTSYTKIYRNVKLYKTGGGYAQAYGGGFSKNCNILFDGCLFSSNDSPVWSTHDNVSGSDFTNITIKGCAFITPRDTSSAMRFATLNDLNGKKAVMIENCYLGSGKIYLDDSETMPNRYALTIIGSGTPTITDDGGNNPYPPVIL